MLIKVEHTWALEAYERDLRHRAKMFFQAALAPPLLIICSQVKGGSVVSQSEREEEFVFSTTNFMMCPRWQ
jgi:hypothetical protein